MGHIYSDTFFDYIDRSARASAKPVISYLFALLKPRSVLDLGCGRGVWLDEWRRAGVSDLLGIDGDYVDRNGLAIAQDAFCAADLTGPVAIGRRFELAQCLEVGEHLPRTAAPMLIDTLTAASDLVLFSAATRGQGGEFHVNEQPLAFWENLFRERGYQAYDCLRPHLKNNRNVAPWYRYNSILYANADGRARLPDEILKYAVSGNQTVQDGGNMLWRFRIGLVSRLPRGAVTGIAKSRALVLASCARLRSVLGRASA